jgi:hypothetical protein
MTGVLYTWINSGTICAKNIVGKRLERMLVIMNDIQLELLVAPSLYETFSNRPARNY